MSRSRELRRRIRAALRIGLALILAGWAGALCADGPEDAASAGEGETPAAEEMPVLPPASQQELRAVWIHTYAPQDWDEICGRLRDHGFNALFARVSRGGNVIYDSEYLPKDTWARDAGVDELQRVCDAAHKAGLQLHAWRVNYHMGSAPLWYRERLEQEGRLSSDPDGKIARFANPGDPRNALLEYRVMMEMVEKYPIDGLHLDYIRYTEVPSYDFDYSDVSRAEFERRIGRRVKRWPLDVRSGPMRLLYDNWMRSNIDGLVRETALGVRRIKPEVMLSAAVWPRHRRYWTLIKQDWPKWVDEGWLDFVVPMDYSGDDERFESLVKEQAGVVDGRRPLVVGIGGWLLESPEQLLRQIAVTRRYGASGFCLFSYLSEQIAEQLEAVRDHVALSDASAMSNDAWIDVRVDGSIPRRDQPRAIVAGRSASAFVGLSVRSDLARRMDRLHAMVFWVDPLTGARTEMGSATGRARAGWRGEVQIPEGISQPWVRGTLFLRDGSTREVWRRGPLFEGLDESAYRDWAARDGSAAPEGPGLRVGVYQPGLGAEKWVEAFGDDPELNVFLLYRLRRDHLAACDVVVVPQLVDASLLDQDACDVLRSWVRDGGSLVLLHDAVGYRLHPPIFGELAWGRELVESTTVQPAEGAGIGDTWTRFEHGYDDHVALTVEGDDARVLATDADGNAVAVAGRWGRGSVLLLGTIFGHPLDREIPPGELEFVRTLVAGLASGEI